MLFHVELIAFSFLDLISKQARLNATVRGFLFVKVRAELCSKKES